MFISDTTTVVTFAKDVTPCLFVGWFDFVLDYKKKATGWISITNWWQ